MMTIKRVDGAGGWNQGVTISSGKACRRYDSECQTIALPEGSDEEAISELLAHCHPLKWEN